YCAPPRLRRGVPAREEHRPATLLRLVRWLLFALSIPAFAQINSDRRIVPGERVGPVTAATTRADLPRLFPGAQAKDDEIELAEGVLEPATQIADLAIV